MKSVNKKLVLLTMGILFINLLVPQGGYMIVAGDSMHPTITKGCNVIESQPWDGESKLEDEIVVYQPVYQDKETYEITNSTEIEHLPLLAHRVVAEYKEYDMNNASYYMNSFGFLEKDTPDNEHRTVYSTNQPHESIESLDGEHVIVLEGDNNRQIDEEIVPVENVKTVLNKDNYYNFQSEDSWPCSIVN